MTPTEDPRLTAAFDLLRRTGAHGFQIRYSDDEAPTIWIACAIYTVDALGLPVPCDAPGVLCHEVEAGLDPIDAVLRLCERVVDGGLCAHCLRPTAFREDLSPTFSDETICWTQWDPELRTFRRACEGDT